MLTNWKYTLTHDWNFMRIFRLGLALLVLFEAWKNAEVLFAALGGILLFQSILNIGCCGTAGCNIDGVEKKPASSRASVKDVTYEEIKK